MDILASDNTTLRERVSHMTTRIEQQARRHVEERAVAKQVMTQLWQYAFAQDSIPFDATWSVYEVANNLPNTTH